MRQATGGRSPTGQRSGSPCRVPFTPGVLILLSFGLLSACGPTPEISSAATPDATPSGAAGWPVTARYEIVVDSVDAPAAAVRSVHEFMGASWYDWTDVVLEGTSPNDAQAVTSDTTSAVSRYADGRFRAGVLIETKPSAGARPLGTAAEVASEFPRGVDVHVDDDAIASGEPSDGVEPTLVGPSHQPLEIVTDDDLGDGPMAPSEMFNPGFGSTWEDAEGAPYRPLEPGEVRALFTGGVGADVEAVAERLQVNPDELTAFAYGDPSTCGTRPDEVDAGQCVRFMSIAHTATGIPLELEHHDLDGIRTTLRVTDVRFSHTRP